MKTYRYSITRKGNKVASGKQEAETMEGALEMVKNKLKITRQDTGTAICNHLDGKPVSVAIFVGV